MSPPKSKESSANTLLETDIEAANGNSQTLPDGDVEKRAGEVNTEPPFLSASDHHVDRPTEASDRKSNGQDPSDQEPKRLKKDWDDAYKVQWDGPNDSDNPHSFSPGRKWLQVLITSSTSLCVTCTSSMYVMTYQQIEQEFHISEELATAGLSLFVFALGLSPMIFAPLSEFYGRRPIYVVSMGLFVIWLIPCALAQNIQTMLVARTFGGLTGSAFLSVAGGTVGDLFDKRSLQLPMLIFTSAPFLGPVIGPIVGGFINSFVDWRWTFWTLLIWAIVQFLAILVLLPETYHPVLQRNKARKMRKGDDRWHAALERHEKSVPQTVIRSCYRPFLLLTQEPMCLNICLLSALLLAILYLFFGAFPLVFMNNHGFNLWQTGLTFCGIGLGMSIAIASDPFWQRRYIRRCEAYEKETGREGATEPEFRLPPAVAGVVLVTIGMFWFGFTTYPSIHWIVPVLGSVVFGTGLVFVFAGLFTFLVDAYPLYAASALAANSFTRSTAAAAFPLFGVQMYERLGYQWATGLLAFLCLAMAPFPYIFLRYGKRIRERSKFASVR